MKKTLNVGKIDSSADILYHQSGVSVMEFEQITLTSPKSKSLTLKRIYLLGSD